MQSENQEIAQLKRHNLYWKNKCLLIQREIQYLQKRIDKLERALEFIRVHPYSKQTNYKWTNFVSVKNMKIKRLETKLKEVRKWIRRYWLRSGDQRLLMKLSEIVK